MPRNSVRSPVGRGTVQSRQIVDYLALKTEWLSRRIGIDPKSLIAGRSGKRFDGADDRRG